MHECVSALVESCVYFSTYNTMNNTGLSSKLKLHLIIASFGIQEFYNQYLYLADLLIIAELLLCLKRTFAVIVLVIASNGFGIVK